MRREFHPVGWAGQWGLRLRQWGQGFRSWAFGLFGLSGALVVGTIQHVVQTCRGNCASCGSCALVLTAAVASASAGVAGRTSGKRRVFWILVLVLAGLGVYGALLAFRRGWLG